MKENRLNHPERLLLAIAVVVIGGCAASGPAPDIAYDSITRELDSALRNRAKPGTPDSVTEALLPPLVVELPRSEGRSTDTRFDLNINNAPANQVFMAVVSGTRYSMIVPADVTEPISVKLKDVTVFEALDTLRELYGYEYRVQGTRITVQSAKLQTRVFQVNYLQATRRGSTDVSVSSGSISGTVGAAAAGGQPAATGTVPAGQPGTVSRGTESSRVTTASNSDFWGDIAKSLNAIVGAADGRSVIVNPQSGVIVVRAMPAELRSVESFLKAMQLVVERQVVLEAKIIEVTLRDSAQTGINWAVFPDGGKRGAAGVVGSNAKIGTSGQLTASGLSATLGAAGGSLVGGAAGGVFGLALQTGNFAALLSFLETQGTINVLSSPRIATINNQKALLKIGTDEFFVTNVSTTAVTSGAGTTTTPTITVQPFFSGIALDVTPQIDENNNILLHIHPAVSSVSEKKKVIDLGAAGSFTLPLASSDVNETDTIVRVQDGNIVAIGGLMKQRTDIDRSRVPGADNAPGLGGLFRQRSSSTVKSELVILLKPTIIHSDRNWEQDLADTRDRIRSMGQTSGMR